jgi:hypothetical protein
MSRIPDGLVRPTDYRADNNEYFSTDGRFIVQRYSSAKWMVKDLTQDGGYGPKLICSCMRLSDAPVEIEHFLREEKAEKLAEEAREKRIEKVAAELRGVVVMGSVMTNEPNYEGEDAADYVRRLYGEHSVTAGFTLADLERIIKHVKGDQYRGPG